MEEIVAREYGAYAPFPPKETLDSLLRWKKLRDKGELLSAALEKAKQGGCPEVYIQRLKWRVGWNRKSMAKLIAPKGYQSWEHVHAFCKAAWGGR